MNTGDIRAELSIKAIELEHALNNNNPHAELIEIYKQLKELQYKLLMSEVQNSKSSYDEIVE